MRRIAIAKYIYALQEMFMAKLGLKGSSKVNGLTIAGIISIATVMAVAVGYAVHRVRMRSVMQNEIRDIMCVLAAPPDRCPACKYSLMCEILETEGCGF